MASIEVDWYTGIIDLSHHQHIEVDWNALKAGGVGAVIHKATGGLEFTDNTFLQRRIEAKAAGFLWGSYHYAGADDSDGSAQADHFLAFVDPAANELVCFDCEKPGDTPDATAFSAPALASMEAFSARVLAKLGRRPLTYGRRLLRSLMDHTPGSPVTQAPLWYDEYPADPNATPVERLPAGWADWTLWQFTDGSHGCEPRQTAGIGPCDRSAFKGTSEQLRALWPW